MSCCWRSVSCLADLVHVHCNIRRRDVHLTNIIMQQRLMGVLFSRVYHIFAVPTMPLAIHSNPVTFHQTRSWKDTCDIYIFMRFHSKTFCIQSRACRGPNSIWIYLLSSADTKGSTRHDKVEMMCTRSVHDGLEGEIHHQTPQYPWKTVVISFRSNCWELPT